MRQFVISEGRLVELLAAEHHQKALRDGNVSRDWEGYTEALTNYLAKNNAVLINQLAIDDVDNYREYTDRPSPTLNELITGLAKSCPDRAVADLILNVLVLLSPADIAAAAQSWEGLQIYLYGLVTSPRSTTVRENFKDIQDWYYEHQETREYVEERLVELKETAHL